MYQALLVVSFKESIFLIVEKLLNVLKDVYN